MTLRLFQLHMHNSVTAWINAAIFCTLVNELPIFVTGFLGGFLGGLALLIFFIILPLV